MHYTQHPCLLRDHFILIMKQGCERDTCRLEVRRIKDCSATWTCECRAVYTAEHRTSTHHLWLMTWPRIRSSQRSMSSFCNNFMLSSSKWGCPELPNARCGVSHTRLSRGLSLPSRRSATSENRFCSTNVFSSFITMMVCSQVDWFWTCPRTSVIETVDGSSKSHN